MYREIRFGFFRTSNIEIEHLLKSWIVICLAFTIATTRFDLKEIAFMFPIALLTVGIGFIFHELAHKIVAQRYGCFAEFRADFNMLILALLTSLFGFVFAAPGAVYIFGYVNVEENGKISLAGPLMNLFIAIIFFALSKLSFGIISSIFYYGFKINSWLALFNLFPIGNLDGRKVLAWNKGIYFVVLIFTIILFFYI